MVAAFFLLHALQPHKELRFLVPLFPLVAALAPGWAGRGAGGVPDSARCEGPWPCSSWRWRAGSALGSGRLTFGDLGQYEDSKPRGERL